MGQNWRYFYFQSLEPILISTTQCCFYLDGTTSSHLLMSRTFLAHALSLTRSLGRGITYNLSAQQLFLVLILVTLSMSCSPLTKLPLQLLDPVIKRLNLKAFVVTDRSINTLIYLQFHGTFVMVGFVGGSKSLGCALGTYPIFEAPSLFLSAS